MSDLRQDCERFSDWLLDRVVASARGDTIKRLEDVQPEGRFWLGRLASEEEVQNSPFGDRTERMAPCAIGIRLRPNDPPPWKFSVVLSGYAWHRTREAGRTVWTKTPQVSSQIPVEIPTSALKVHSYEAEKLREEFGEVLGVQVLRALVRIDVEKGRDGNPEIVVSFVNTSPENSSEVADTGIYQAELQIKGLPTRPFLLESLPDSFRYDRRIPAFGINCGVDLPDPDTFRSTDIVHVDRSRPTYWVVDDPQPDCGFHTLATEPLPSLRQLVESHGAWGKQAWAPEHLDQRMRSESWSQQMRAQAEEGAEEFWEEAQRLKKGLELLENNQVLCRSFQLMNEGMRISSRDKYDAWRPFQLGFILANIPSILGEEDETSIVDILWFATGGGKTETYLGLLMMAAFYDRLTGKATGITAWSRFPLRLLSLQQTQRFADAVAAAEMVRIKHKIKGAIFSLGFFVGDGNTPNRILKDPPAGKPDPYDDTMPTRFQVLIRCPFCTSNLGMNFNRKTWRLEHRCLGNDCPWKEEALPFYIVDEEIFRYLPTIVVGTLDKVASVSMQAAMRGFVSAPYGICSEATHGYVYAPRSDRPNGCLVPGCRGGKKPLRIPEKRYPPTFRLQDELHLLRDSLGAMDSHYESLLDHLTGATSDIQPKIVASSATLTGYQHQCRTLYQRRGRVFPTQGPRVNESFWSCDSQQRLRRYVALSPRGATLEFASDRLVTELQTAIRELQDEPTRLCAQIGIDVANAEEICLLFGTNVIYGNTIRDIDASVRSLETQVPVEPLIAAQLTGHTPFSEVRSILHRLEKPEANFDDRVHVVAASSMMSHGVDVNRLNTMVMLGLPLTTAEFIQATARIGRTWPGIVLVLHKMALERDASIFRSFQPFIEQGDRFVEAIPVTRRSRKVVERTVPGLVMARLLHLHEPAAGGALTTIARVQKYFRDKGINAQSELTQLEALLCLDPSLDAKLRDAILEILQAFFRKLNDPATNEKFPNQLFPTVVMRSLRDVEEQAPVYD